MIDRLKMQDPRHQYPKPPFPEQPQPVPVIAGAAPLAASPRVMTSGY
jgi:hypothetical protein